MCREGGREREDFWDFALFQRVVTLNTLGHFSVSFEGRNHFSFVSVSLSLSAAEGIDVIDLTFRMDESSLERARERENV